MGAQPGIDGTGAAGPDDRPRQVDTDQLVAAADVLTAAGDEITGLASGVPRALPPLPDDRHGLVQLAVRLDASREAFDRLLGDRLEEAGRYLSIQAFDVAAADSGAEFAHLPASGR